MKASRSFDRAADFYDQTRPLFEAAVDAGMRSLPEEAGEGACAAGTDQTGKRGAAGDTTRSNQ